MPAKVIIIAYILYNDLFLKGTLFDQIVIGYDNLFLLSIIIDQLIIGYFNCNLFNWLKQPINIGCNL